MGILMPSDYAEDPIELRYVPVQCCRVTTEYKTELSQVALDIPAVPERQYMLLPTGTQNLRVKRTQTLVRAQCRLTLETLNGASATHGTRHCLVAWCHGADPNMFLRLSSRLHKADENFRLAGSRPWQEMSIER